MIIPITIDDSELIVLHKKINRETSNISLQQVRERVDDLIRRYVSYELLEEVYEDFTDPPRRKEA